MNIFRRRCGVLLPFWCRLPNYDLLTSLLPVTHTRRRAHKQPSSVNFLFGPPRTPPASMYDRHALTNARADAIGHKTHKVCCTTDYIVTPSFACGAREGAVKPATYSLCHFILFLSLSLSKYSSLPSHFSLSRCSVEKINGYG